MNRANISLYTVIDLLTVTIVIIDSFNRQSLVLLNFGYCNLHSHGKQVLHVQVPRAVQK